MSAWIVLYTIGTMAKISSSRPISLLLSVLRKHRPAIVFILGQKVRLLLLCLSFSRNQQQTEIDRKNEISISKRWACKNTSYINRIRANLRSFVGGGEQVQAESKSSLRGRTVSCLVKL